MVLKHFMIATGIIAFLTASTFSVILIALNSDIDILSASFEQLQFENNKIENEVKLLEIDVTNLTIEVGLLNALFKNTIIDQQTELSQLKGEFQDMENQLSYYFNWLKTNSNLGDDVPFGVKKYIDECDLSVIKLPCVAMKNEKNLKLEYLDDSDLGKSDFIQNISFTIDRGGGDCEDFSTIFMAELNYLRDKSPLSFETFKPAIGKNYYIFGGWYLPNAEAHLISGDNVYVACYSQLESGHCINAICTEDIISKIKREGIIPDVTEFCEFVEPQNYGILMTLEESEFGTVFVEGGIAEPFYGWVLFMSSEDLCMSTDSGWKCFSNYSERITEILE